MTRAEERDPPSDLQPARLPASTGEWSRWLASTCSAGLDDARRLMDEIAALPAGSDPLTALRAWNDLSIAMSAARAPASLLMQVHPDEKVRTEAEQASQQADKLATDISLNRALYDVLAALDVSRLDADAARVLRLTLRDFVRAGVDRDDHTRARLRELAEQETVLGQQFSRNIRDDVRSIAVEGWQLKGLPDDYVSAHPADDDGLHRITTDYPDVGPFLAFAEDPAARRALLITFLSRAWPDNEGVLSDLLALRAEHASLLGYDGWANYDAEVKMIGSGSAIGAFIDQIAAATDESGRRDRDVLLERLRQDRPDAAAIDRGDATYYAEVVRRETFDVDAQQVRRYFDAMTVRQGLLDVTSRLFGLAYTAVPDAAGWHDEVVAYDVALDDRPIGRIYLDLHPREGKYKHAAQFDLVSGVEGRQLAEGVLVCNFPRGLMEHRDVVTLFHEFGHLIHHVLAGRHPWVRFSGVATEWDFVEAPSQLLEEWAWDPEVLRTFAVDSHGEAIPAELVARMRAANGFGKGYLARTQTFYAAIAYQLHLLSPDEDIPALIRRVNAAYDLLGYVEGTHFEASFGHLVGYASAYYTYLWSLVIAKDLFSAFDSADLFDTGTAARYRDTILAAGGSRDAAELVEDFLGRPYDITAFSSWLAGPS